MEKFGAAFTSVRRVAVESKCLCWKINYSKKLDYFLIYVLFAHTALLFKMFQERTDYSPVDMEITSRASNTLRLETPRIGESISREDHNVVRRNLMNFFCDVNAFGTPLQASTPRCVDSTSVKQNTGNEQSFVYKFISWICVLILGSAFVFELYQHFPGYMLLLLTNEFLICGALVILCVLLFTIIVKDKLNQRS